MKIDLSWTQFKNHVIITKGLKYQYIEQGNRYFIFASEGTIDYYCYISIEDPANTNQIDWVNNYQENANQNMTMNVNIENEVDVNVGSDQIVSESLRFKPCFYSSKEDIYLSNTLDTELVNINVDGQLDAISVNFDRDDVEFVLEVDGGEVLRVILEDLKSECKYDLKRIGHGWNTKFPIIITNNGKHIILNYENYPPSIISNITLKARKTKQAQTKMKSILIVYREKIL